MSDTVTQSRKDETTIAAATSSLAASDADARGTVAPAADEPGAPWPQVLPPDTSAVAADHEVLCNVLAQIVRRLLNEASAGGESGRTDQAKRT